MAHIIGDIAVMPRMANRIQILNCFGKDKSKICHRDVFNPETVNNIIEQAAKVKQKLESDIFERNKTIEQRANYRKEFL